MHFQRALDQAVAKLRKAAIERRTELKRRAYHVSRDKVLARLYGYKLVRDVAGGAHAEVVAEEALIVREVIRGFADGLSAEVIKARLDSQGARNRSGKPFSRSEIRRLVRPWFAGCVKGPLGTLRRSRVYAPIVSRSEWQKAAENLSKDPQNEELVPPWDTHGDDFRLFSV